MGHEYFVRDGLGVRKVEGEVGLFGVAEGGPFHQVEKQVVCAISPFASRVDVVIALRSLTAYFEQLPDSEFGTEIPDQIHITHGARERRRGPSLR